MTSYLDMGHKLLFVVILVRFRSLRNDSVIDESSCNHYVTVLMTSHVDMSHKVLFGVTISHLYYYIMITQWLRYYVMITLSLRNSQKMTHIDPIPESYRPNIHFMTHC